MSGLTPAFLEEVRSRSSLSTLIGRTVKLKRAGREWSACCPFHNEKTPSFTVNDDKAFYHCFGCGAHGDAIDWLVNRQGLEFRDAVAELAAAAGLQMPTRPSAATDARAISLGDVLARAASWFEEQLALSAGAGARACLDRRGISPTLARSFGLGFAPGGRSALRSAFAGAGDAVLIDAGLLVSPEDGGTPYDRFRERLMIPIRDRRGRVIAFGGRALGDGGPKYLNSPETMLFDKGSTLFNADRAAPAARKTRELLVVEGYLDVVALAGAGIEHAVAPLGTAITERQLEAAWRMVETPTLMLDGDEAGGKAAFRAAERALPDLTPNRTLRVARLPTGSDPDDVVRAGGADAIEAIAAAAAPLAEFLFDREAAIEPLGTPEQRVGLKRRLEGHATAIRDRELSWQYQAEFRRRANALFRGDRRAPSAARGLVDPHRIDLRVLEAVVHGLYLYPDVAAHEAERLYLLAGDDPALDARLEDVAAAAMGAERRVGTPPLPPLGFRFAFNRSDRPKGAAEHLGAVLDTLIGQRDGRRAS